MKQSSELFSSFGEVAALEIFREPSNYVYVRYFEDSSADLLLELVAKDLQARLESKSFASPDILSGAIITAWEVPAEGLVKEVLASPSSPGLGVAASASSSSAMPCDRRQVGLPDLRHAGQAPFMVHQERAISLDEGSDKSDKDKLSGRIQPDSEVIFERVLSGEDRRTTIMVRNLSKKGKSSDFIDALKAVDLWTSLNFYYMPFDKNRNRFCGFAFLDFRDPAAILRFRHAKFPEELVKNGPLGISYAHIQGLATIHANFSDSLIMEEPDETKRPIFLTLTKPMLV